MVSLYHIKWSLVAEYFADSNPYQSLEYVSRPGTRDSEASTVNRHRSSGHGDGSAGCMSWTVWPSSHFEDKLIPTKVISVCSAPPL